MSQEVQYNVKDTQGNIYGPASAQMLRDWVREGRIVRGMAIAPEGTDNWMEVSGHPALIDLFGGTATAVAASAVAPTPTAAVPVTATVIDPVMTPQPTGISVPTNTPVVRSGGPGSMGGQWGSVTHPGGPHVNIPAAIGVCVGMVAFLSLVGVCCCGILGGVGSGLLALVAMGLGGFGFFQVHKAPGYYVFGRAIAMAAVLLGGLALVAAIVLSVIHQLEPQWFK